MRSVYRLYMVRVSPDLWNLLFGWMSGQQCFLPEGCDVPVQGMLVYLVILVFLAVLVYWFRHDIRDAVGAVREGIGSRVPNPFS